MTQPEHLTFHAWGISDRDKIEKLLSAPLMIHTFPSQLIIFNIQIKNILKDKFINWKQS